MYDFFNVTKNYLCFSKIRNTLASKHEQIGVAGFSLAPRGWRVNRMGSLAISSPQKNRLSRGRFGRGRDTRNLFWCTLDRLKQPQNTALTFFFSLLRNVLVAQPLPRRKTTMSPLYHPFDPCNTFLVLDDFFGENEASARRIVLHTHTHTLYCRTLKYSALFVHVRIPVIRREFTSGDVCGGRTSLKKPK